MSALWKVWKVWKLFFWNGKNGPEFSRDFYAKPRLFVAIIPLAYGNWTLRCGIIRGNYRFMDLKQARAKGKLAEFIRSRRRRIRSRGSTGFASS